MHEAEPVRQVLACREVFRRPGFGLWRPTSAFSVVGNASRFSLFEEGEPGTCLAAQSFSFSSSSFVLVRFRVTRANLPPLAFSVPPPSILANPPRSPNRGRERLGR